MWTSSPGADARGAPADCAPFWTTWTWVATSSMGTSSCTPVSRAMQGDGSHRRRAGPERCSVRRQARRPGPQAVQEPRPGRAAGQLPAGDVQVPGRAPVRVGQARPGWAGGLHCAGRQLAQHMDDPNAPPLGPMCAALVTGLRACVQPQDTHLPHPHPQPHLPGLRLLAAAGAPLPQGGQHRGRRGDCGQPPAGGVQGAARCHSRLAHATSPPSTLLCQPCLGCLLLPASEPGAPAGLGELPLGG